MRPLDDVCVVVPTIGRASLSRLLAALSNQTRQVGRIVVVDDRFPTREPLPVPASLAGRSTVLRSGGRGPAAARNTGWLTTDAKWIVFLDDDVVPSPPWSSDLAADLDVADDVGAVQARIVVPLPEGRRPDDRERNVARLADAPWITADLAVRRRALEEVGGFDERFRRAYREDTDLALRLRDRGWRLAAGARKSHHPVQPAPWWASVAAQRGNRDDALMLALHGRRWRAQPGRRRRHAGVASMALAGVLFLARGRRRLAAACAVGWLFGTAEFAASRIAAGPRTPREVASMLVTSLLIPPTAVAYWVAGRIAHWPGRTASWPTSERQGGLAVRRD